MTDRSDGITLSWTPPNASPRRLTLEPRDVGGWDRIEEEWRGEWVTVGREIVASVDLEAPAAIVHDDSPILG